MQPRLAALVTCVALVVAACGDGDSTSVTAPDTTSSPSSSFPASTAAPSASSSPSSAPAPSEVPANEPEPSAPAPSEPPPADVVEALPDVTVQDVTAGTQVSLASLLPADRPILLWMWAPH